MLLVFARLRLFAAGVLNGDVGGLEMRLMSVICLEIMSSPAAKMDKFQENSLRLKKKFFFFLPEEISEKTAGVAVAVVIIQYSKPEIGSIIMTSAMTDDEKNACVLKIVHDMLTNDVAFEDLVNSVMPKNLMEDVHSRFGLNVSDMMSQASTDKDTIATLSNLELLLHRIQSASSLNWSTLGKKDLEAYVADDYELAFNVVEIVLRRVCSLSTSVTTAFVSTPRPTLVVTPNPPPSNTSSSPAQSPTSPMSLATPSITVVSPCNSLPSPSSSTCGTPKRPRPASPNVPSKRPAMPTSASPVSASQKRPHGSIPTSGSKRAKVAKFNIVKFVETDSKIGFKGLYFERFRACHSTKKLDFSKFSNEKENINDVLKYKYEDDLFSNNTSLARNQLLDHFKVFLQAKGLSVSNFCVCVQGDVFRKMIKKENDFLISAMDILARDILVKNGHALASSPSQSTPSKPISKPTAPNAPKKAKKYTGPTFFLDSYVKSDGLHKLYQKMVTLGGASRRTFKGRLNFASFTSEGDRFTEIMARAYKQQPPSFHKIDEHHWSVFRSLIYNHSYKAYDSAMSHVRDFLDSKNISWNRYRVDMSRADFNKLMIDNIEVLVQTMDLLIVEALKAPAPPLNQPANINTSACSSSQSRNPLSNLVTFYQNDSGSFTQNDTSVDEAIKKAINNFVVKEEDTATFTRDSNEYQVDFHRSITDASINNETRYGYITVSNTHTRVTRMYFLAKASDDTNTMGADKALTFEQVFQPIYDYHKIKVPSLSVAQHNLDVRTFIDQGFKHNESLTDACDRHGFNPFVTDKYPGKRVKDILVRVSKNSKEYQLIEARVGPKYKNKIKHIDIVPHTDGDKIFRMLAKKETTFSAFHGTSSTDPESLEPFAPLSRRYSSSGYAGRGVYLAESIGYPLMGNGHYTYGNDRKIILCDVIAEDEGFEIKHNCHSRTNSELPHAKNSSTFVFSNSDANPGERVCYTKTHDLLMIMRAIISTK